MGDLREQRCTKCDRSRAAGWILVDGLCWHCGTGPFEERRQELLEQASQLLAERHDAARGDGR